MEESPGLLGTVCVCVREKRERIKKWFIIQLREGKCHFPICWTFFFWILLLLSSHAIGFIIEYNSKS